MRYDSLGGVRVPVVGQGTWAMEHDPDPVAALRLGLDLGMTHVDTAEMYGRGAVEELVGAAIAGRRDEVFLASKVLPENASRERAVEACELSLRRLGTDHLDLYLLHAPSTHPFEETLAAFEELVARGLIGAYGVSNFDAQELAEAAERAGPGGIKCNQVVYHLLDREAERELLGECRRLGIALVGYSPLGQGRFPSSDPVLGEIAAEAGVTPQQVALAFLTRLPGSFAIPKSSDLRHVRENAAAADLHLTAAQIERLDVAFRA